MGRILDLFGEVAAEADEGTEGLELSPDAWDRLRKEWKDEDIDDALGLVHESLLQSELVEAAESLTGRLLDILGVYGNPAPFAEVTAGKAVLTADVLGQIARRVDRLDEVLGAFRSGDGPDRTKFDALRNHLLNVGIEKEMASDDDGAFSEDDERE
jgi:hypothetical protein